MSTHWPASHEPTAACTSALCLTMMWWSPLRSSQWAVSGQICPVSLPSHPKNIHTLRERSDGAFDRYGKMFWKGQSQLKSKLYHRKMDFQIHSMKCCWSVQEKLEKFLKVWFYDSFQNFRLNLILLIKVMYNASLISTIITYPSIVQAFLQSTGA